VAIIAAGGASGSNHGASSRERQNAQRQKGEAYARNRELLASAKPEHFLRLRTRECEAAALLIVGRASPRSE